MFCMTTINVLKWPNMHQTKAVPEMVCIALSTSKWHQHNCCSFPNVALLDHP